MLSSSKSKSRSKSRSRSRTYSPDRGEEGRLHVANIDETIRARDLEDAFGCVILRLNVTFNWLMKICESDYNIFNFRRYGKLKEVWVASYPPLFAFVVFKSKSDAQEAMSAMNNTSV